MPPLPGSRDFYWYRILDFFLFVLLTLRVESRALPLRSDNWELNKCSITELQPRLFFSPHFYSETGSPSLVLSFNSLSQITTWILNLLQSNWAFFFFFFTSGHILDFKDNPNILQTSLPLPSWYFFFPFHSFPLFFETVLLCNPGRSWYHNSLASIPTTEMIGHWNEGYVWKKNIK